MLYHSKSWLVKKDNEMAFSRLRWRLDGHMVFN